jgi:hypothetical protein
MITPSAWNFWNGDTIIVGMADETPREEIERRAKEMARRVLNTPPKPRTIKPPQGRGKESAADKEHRPRLGKAWSLVFGDY